MAFCWLRDDVISLLFWLIPTLAQVHLKTESQENQNDSLKNQNTIQVCKFSIFYPNRVIKYDSWWLTLTHDYVRTFLSLEFSKNSHFSEKRGNFEIFSGINGSLRGHFKVKLRTGRLTKIFGFFCKNTFFFKIGIFRDSRKYFRVRHFFVIFENSIIRFGTFSVIFSTLIWKDNPLLGDFRSYDHPTFESWQIISKVF